MEKLVESESSKSTPGREKGSKTKKGGRNGGGRPTDLKGDTARAVCGPWGLNNLTIKFIVP